MIGIYAIRNRVNGKVYIGQSTNIQKRFKQHIDALEKGIHHSWKLQKDYDEFGIGSFAFEVVELCPKEKLDEKELEWITKFDSIRNGYNVQDNTAKKGWLSKNKTNPAVTVSGRLLRIARDFGFELLDDFEQWLRINRTMVKNYVRTLLGIFSFVALLSLGVSVGELIEKGFGGFVAAVLIVVTGAFGLHYADQKRLEKPKRKWALYYGGQRQTPFYYADTHEQAVKQGEALLASMKKDLGEGYWDRIYPQPSLWEIRSMEND